MISIYDLIRAVTGVENPRDAWLAIREQIEAEVVGSILNIPHIFDGQGQRDTPVTDAKGMVAIINRLPGKRAAQFRMKSADLVVRFLGGDQSLIDEIQRNSELQEALPSNHPARIFGETVEAERPQEICE